MPQAAQKRLRLRICLTRNLPQRQHLSRPLSNPFRQMSLINTRLFRSPSPLNPQ